MHGTTSGASAMRAASGPGTRRSAGRSLLRRAASLTSVAAVTVALLLALPIAEAAAAPTNSLTVQVVSARTEPRAFAGAGVSQGDPVNAFKFIINRDNTGATNIRTATGVCSPSYDPPPGEPGYPRSCPWTSLNADPDASPIVAQGDQDTLAAGLDLPDGKYLISVLADGYKLDGAHFTMPLPADNPVEVEVQPMPLPDSTVKGQVFEDMAPTNGAYDAGERAAAGLRRPSQRRPRRDQHRRVRQPAVHDVRR